LDKKYASEDYLHYWDRIRFSRFVNDFIQKKEKQSTKEYYLYCAKKFIEKAGDLYIDEINQFDIDLILKDEKLNQNSKATVIRGLKAILNEAVNLNLRKEIKINRVKEMKIEREIITEREIELLLDDLKDENHRLVVRFMLASGFRLNEVIKLRWENISWERGIIYLLDTKSKKKDVFPLLDEIKDLLWPIAKEKGSVFGYKSVDSLSYLRKKMRKHRINFQDFRRYFATKWAKELQPAELKILMRHSSINTTMSHYIYLKLDDVSKKIKSKKTDTFEK